MRHAARVIGGVSLMGELDKAYEAAMATRRLADELQSRESKEVSLCFI